MLKSKLVCFMLLIPIALYAEVPPPTNAKSPQATKIENQMKPKKILSSIKSEQIKINNLELTKDNQIIREAYNLYKQNNLDQAILLLMKQENLNYNNEKYTLFLIRLLVIASNLDEVRSISENILRKYPNYYNIRLELAKIYLSNEQNEQALDILLEKQPPQSIYPQYYNLIAYIYFSENQYKKAIDIYLKNLDHNPNNIQSLLGLALSYDNLDQRAKAVNAYRKILDQEQLVNQNIRRTVYNRVDDLLSLEGNKDA